MTLIEQLCLVAETYKDARKLSRARVSTLVFGDGSKLGAIVDKGADLTTSRFEQSLLWFSENWPDDAIWPVEVPRPDSPFETEPQHDA